MPYIKQSDRAEIDDGLRGPELPGELAYVVYSDCKEYMDKFDLSFTLWNDVVGVLRNVEAELRRRYKVDEYEDSKIKENGDID